MATTTLDLRYSALHAWLSQQYLEQPMQIEPLAGDASFRRYFRVQVKQKTYIAMDAPPDKENTQPFMAVAQVFAELGLSVPQIIAADSVQGFLLLSDLGDDLYSSVLAPENADNLYTCAIRKLLIIQTCQSSNTWQFPPFDRAMLMAELAHFREWFLIKHLQLSLSLQEEALLTHAFTQLVDSALAQPQVCVHRDYHSRNLLRMPNQGIGILDFQDAVWGPVTYDLVSLIRDCYIDWPKSQIEKWASYYQQHALATGIINETNLDIFMRWFDWMGIQRHLKAIYIFARKFRRDDNPNYLNYIPRTLGYVLDTTEHYTEFAELNAFLHKRVLTHESYDFSSRPWQAPAPAD